MTCEHRYVRARYQIHARHCAYCFESEPRSGLMIDYHKGLPVAGYRDQPGAAVELVNVNKLIEERVLRILDDLRLDHTVDQRWLQIGRTHIEQGFMAVNRAIFKPARVELNDS